MVVITLKLREISVQPRYVLCQHGMIAVQTPRPCSRVSCRSAHKDSWRRVWTNLKSVSFLHRKQWIYINIAQEGKTFAGSRLKYVTRSAFNARKKAKSTILLGLMANAAGGRAMSCARANIRQTGVEVSVKCHGKEVEQGRSFARNTSRDSVD